MADSLKGAVILLADGRFVRAKGLTAANLGPSLYGDEGSERTIEQNTTPSVNPQIAQASTIASGSASQGDPPTNKSSTENKGKTIADRGDLNLYVGDNRAVNSHTTNHQNASSKHPSKGYTLECIHCKRLFSRNDTVRLHLIKVHYRTENPDIPQEDAQAKARKDAP